MANIDNSVFGIYIVLIFGVVGYFMRQFNSPATPLLLERSGAGAD